MKLRPATPADAIDILNWRNDPHTRAMSKNSEMIDEARHLEWFRAAIADPQRLLLIGEHENQKIGMVRFDYEGNAWKVSINLAPQMRGKGFGYLLLKSGLNFLRSVKNADSIFAEIKAGNNASLSIFSKCGFVVSNEHGGYIEMVFNPLADQT